MPRSFASAASAISSDANSTNDSPLGLGGGEGMDVTCVPGPSLLAGHSLVEHGCARHTPSVGSDNKMDAHGSLGDIEALKELQDEIRRRVEGQAAQPHNALHALGGLGGIRS